MLLLTRVFRRIFFAALAATILAATAGAQQDNTVANWANLNQLVQGSEIRVTLTTGRTVRGFIQGVTPESLAINATTSQETLLREDIRRIALKSTGHRGRNTLIGLGVGTAAGLALGAGIDSHAGPGNWFPNAGKAVLSPLGAIVGTVVGVALPTGGWHDVYRPR